MGMVRNPVLYFGINNGTNTIKVFVNVPVAKAYDFESEFFQLFCAHGVLLLGFRIIMSAAI